MIIHRNNTTETVILSGVGENILVVERRLRSGGRIASHLAATVARDQRSRWKVVQRGRIQLIMVGSGAQTLLELSYTLSTRLTWLDRKGFARTRIRSSGDDIVVASVQFVHCNRKRKIQFWLIIDKKKKGNVVGTKFSPLHNIHCNCRP